MQFSDFKKWEFRNASLVGSNANFEASKYEASFLAFKMINCGMQMMYHLIMFISDIKFCGF